MNPTTAYTVRDDGGRGALVFSPERAERLSRAGLHVTARTE